MSGLVNLSSIKPKHAAHLSVWTRLMNIGKNLFKHFDIEIP
jgi:hypothetical protein